MGRIAVPATGNVIVGPVDAPRPPPGAFDRGGRALEAIGRAGAEIAGTAMADQLRQEERLADTAAKVAAVNARTRVQTGLHDLAGEFEDGILKGTIDTGSAREEFAKRAKALIDESVAGLDPLGQRIAEADLQGLAARSLERVVNAARVRNQRTVLGGLDAAEEQYLRIALTDRARATREFLGTLHLLGPDAGLQPDQILARGQRFRERVAFDVAASAVNGARDDLGSLKALRERIGNPEEFGDLDPAKRTQLETAIDARMQAVRHQLELAAQRAQLAEERRQRDAEKAYGRLQDLIDGGRVPSADEVAMVAALTRGTPYALMVPSLIDQAADRAGFASRPPAQQQAILDAARGDANSGGSTEFREKRLAALERIAERTRRDVQDDPLRAAFERRAIDGRLDPLPVTDLSAFGQALGARVRMARDAAVWAGRPVSPLTKDEAARLGQLLDSLPVAQRAGALKLVADAIPDAEQRRALAGQVAEGKKALGLALAATSWQTSRGRTVAELILKGADAEASKTLVDKPRNATDVADIARAVDSVQWSSQQARDAALQASLYVYNGLRTEGVTNAAQALELATGGVMDWNGARITRPWGWSESDTRNALLRGRSAETLRAMAGGEQVMVGGKPLPVAALASQWREVQLRNFGEGSYAVLAGGAVVMLPTGKPFLFRVEQ